MKMRNKIVSIDFDGTIVSNKFPEIGVLQGYAKDVINRLHEDYIIIINTCRSQEYEYNCVKFLKEAGIKYDWINHNDPGQIIKFGADCRKISADIYIDDKCLFGLPYYNGIVDWQAIYILIKKKLDGG